MVSTLDKETIEIAKRELARRKHKRFIKYCWTNHRIPFYVGFHTQKICDRLDQALIDFGNNKSTYIAIAVHHRAGKSEMVSVNLPPRFIGMFPGCEVMNVTYSANLAQKFSRRARSVVESPQFKELYPNVGLSAKSQAANRWEITYNGEITNGGFTASGLSSGLTGSGAHLAVLDDYLSGRRAAESFTQRDNVWQSFTNDFMTRLAPVHIVLIIATWWHFDDVRGRIQRAMNPEDEEYYDPSFPEFEFMDFPARAELYQGEDVYPGEYLFDHIYNEKDQEWEDSPDNWFQEKWYQSQYATLGRYASAGIMDCNPVPRGGSMLNIENVVVHSTQDEIPEGLKWYRVWDYAHTAKQRTSDDPDYTGGTLLSFCKMGYNQDLKQWIWELWIKDYIQFRLSATERDKKIREIAKKDGPGVKLLVESSLDSLDGADYLKAQIAGLRVVISVKVQGDKVVRVSPLEPVFDNGNVHIIRGAWNRVWLDGIERFDGSGKSHDEMVDNISCGYKYICVGSGYGILRNPYL